MFDPAGAAKLTPDVASVIDKAGAAKLLAQPTSSVYTYGVVGVIDLTGAANLRTLVTVGVFYAAADFVGAKPVQPNSWCNRTVFAHKTHL